MAKSYINDLHLIESTERGFSPEDMKRAHEAGLFVIRGCTRHVAMGTEPDIREFRAHLDAGSIHEFAGKDAYSHMLQYITGLFSKTRGESQIVSQFKNAFAELQEHHPEQARHLDYLYQSILADNALIRTHVTADLRPAFFESTAHNLSDQNGGETVLLVGDVNAKSQRPSDVTRNIVKQLANNRKDKVGRLLVTHPEDLTAQHLAQQLKREKLATDPEHIPFSEAVDKGLVDHHIRNIYVTLPMDKYPTADKALIEAAGEWEAFGTKLVHLGGNAKADRVTRGHWKEADLELGILPETVSEAQAHDKAHNAELVAAGTRAANNCGISRAKEKPPIRKYLTAPSDTYAHLTGSNTESLRRK